MPNIKDSLKPIKKLRYNFKINKKKPIINYFFLIFFFLIILQFFNATYSAYSILLWDYSERMTQSYGYCKNESWGFYNHVIKKYNLENKKIKIINDEGYVLIHALFKNISITDKNYKYLMILNFQSENSEDIYDIKVDNIEKYSIKYKFNNCYLLELND